ncbi:hypothetical protein GCM10011584_07370 [Nocardioides phosphati]|uniref:Uncharacterized protein n=1 Tax=Nocardioides phosphati TaxID=1867775 RepID=A0ABQ2N8K9_9ACTN|nr:hypothetical protein [Nocardioides phosphati]GGO86020.1 hypothetical protein GCM10011584_07370 [Nocardioides phosphati]
MKTWLGRLPAAAVVGGVALAGVGGYALGSMGTATAHWHGVTIKRAAVVSNGDHRLLTVRDKDWSYGLVDSVTHWIDREGSLHQGGWPSCLEPAHPMGGPEANPGVVAFRFASVKTKLDGGELRPVVLVDCRA